MRASETLTAEQARDRIDSDAHWIDAIMRRIAAQRDDDGPWDVLDVGAAQGRAVAALLRAGHRAVGVEPHAPAVEQAAELGRLLDLPIDVREGAMEQLPFPDGSFDVVIATSVLEHVVDVDRSLAEVHRVLRPGGVFWFDTASSMCPFQSEIAHVPLFGWYPLPVKRAIMRWAQRHRPAWIGHTSVPAMHWFTPRSANRRLRRAGFVEVVDRWQLRLPDEDTGRRATLVRLARRSVLFRFIGNVAVTGCSYLARRAPAA